MYKKDMPPKPEDMSFACSLVCDDFVAVFCDQNLNFPLGRRFSVLCVYGPVIIRVHEYIRLPMLTIGSMVNIMPGTMSISVPRSDT